ncbi:hypothetical protein CTAYLR_006487 [Chrysophaeum taylorii]|uniref:Uncharacterized protein n=1 Tax=Chrysophaeum taylorii TaxID=2483200 RepID=A0AAD7XQM9_9STRA|nr:hypothetical protein CTAYLR_006487 [Chrysophaeum taylorii]
MESIAGAYGSDSDEIKGEEAAEAEEEEEEKKEEPAPKRARTEERPVLSPEPPGEADPELTKRLAQFREKGYNPTQHIRQNREFANPQILQKIVDYFEIDDIGSCYPTHIFDPHAIVARRAKEKES